MKRLKSNPIIKAVAVILTCLLTVTFFFTAAATVVLSVTDAYSDPDGLREQVHTDLAHNAAYEVENYFHQLEKDTLLSGEYGLPRRFHPDQTNLRFTVTDADEVTVLSNEDAPTSSAYQYTFFVALDYTERSQVSTFSDYDEADAYVKEFERRPDTTIISCYYEPITDDNGSPAILLGITWVESVQKEFTISFSLPLPFTAKDATYDWITWLNLLIDLRWTILTVMLTVIVPLILLIVFLCNASGYRKGSDDPTLNLLDRIPLDLYLIAATGLFTAILYIWHIVLEEVVELNHSDLLILFMIGSVLGAIALAAMLTVTIMTVATRIKCRTFVRNTLIYRIFSILGKVVRWTVYLAKNISLYWKFALIAIILTVLEGALIFSRDVEVILFGAILGNLILIPIALYSIVQYKKLLQATKRIAAGETAYQIDSQYMVMEFKSHAETLNSIGEGLQKAIDERMKSERFKTELITNVSHDIKTPLTSIINYVDLLKKEEIDSSTVNEYISVLDRHSARLKKLIEDLVEASKASTGNLSVNAEKLDMNLLISQTTAEFHEKLTTKNLILITAPANDPNSMVIADGKHLWRVMENLMSNICKYAQEHTRVYISTAVMDQTVRITLKNTSKFPLNISSEELMERFSRGDSSRHTEGSGLGLSIARSLVELQQGSFDVIIDGDLFKVIIDLPRAKE